MSVRPWFLKKRVEPSGVAPMEELDGISSSTAIDGESPTGIYEPANDGALQQGDVLSGIVHYTLNVEELGRDELVVDETPHQFVIVVSQSCDLEWDHEARKTQQSDKLLPNVLLCEALTAEEVKGRKNADGQVINNSKIWPRIRDNKDDRFHFFEQVPRFEDVLGEGLPELVVDFKRYFSVPTAELYWRLDTSGRRRARLCSPYLEHFATRFFQFQARIATPRQHLSL